MRDFLRINIVWILVAIVGETFVAPAIAIGGIAPDFSIIALVVLALAAGPFPATLGGFLLGLIQDLTNPSLLGLKALCKTYLGFALGRLRDRLVYGMPVVEAVVVALAVLGHDLIFLLVQSRLSDEAFLIPFFTQALPVAVYSAVVGVLVLRLVDLAGVMRRED